jgi:hypothetical protein
MPLGFSAASQFSIAVLKADRRAAREALRLARKVVRADIRGRAHRGSSQALTRVVRVPSILLVPALPALAPAVLVVRLDVLALVRVLVLALRVLAALAPAQADRRRRVKLRALRVLRDRRAVVDASSIPKPKKAR